MRPLRRGGILPWAAMDDDRPLITLADLEAVTVGPVKRLDGTVRLVDADPGWPALFEVEADRIRSSLGDDARRIEHVGSTSVAGMPAKPVIDILLVVDDSADESAYLPRLEAAGYRLRIREPALDEHRLCKGPDADINLHILSVGAPEIDRMLRFRDRLRSCPDEFALYLATKRELAGRRWEFVQQYADAKGEVIEAIIGRAASAADDGAR